MAGEMDSYKKGEIERPLSLGDPQGPTWFQI